MSVVSDGLPGAFAKRADAQGQNTGPVDVEAATLV